PSWCSARMGQASGDLLIEGERTARHRLTRTVQGRGRRVAGRGRWTAWETPMAWQQRALIAALQQRVHGDEATLLEDTNLVGERVHLHDPRARA
ncbi:MAG TPA: hypothetical protein VN277_00915, partial [Acidiferrobacterales bacterium]|nr:hypothetical protein [Acidiferrobacterales bacterium]